MRPAVKINDTQWFCLGRIIEQNDHPRLPAYSSWKSDEHETDARPHSSFASAVEYCKANPFLQATETLTDLGVHYKTPNKQMGMYKGAFWNFVNAYNCYTTDVAPYNPFPSLRACKEYITDYMENTVFDEFE